MVSGELRETLRERAGVWWYGTDYLRRDREDTRKRPGVLADRGFWLHLPRPMVACRLLGHRPVADGTEPFRERRPAHMWVACDRCALRPAPQGSLDPMVWEMGMRADLAELSAPGAPGVLSAPGPWPATEDGVIGAELIIGRSPSAGISVKVGNKGSEHTLAGHITMGPVGGLYLHTERIGSWFQRRLVPRGYESMATEVHVGDGRLRWQLWHPRDSWTRGTPWWRHGSVRLDPRDVAWGEKRYSYADTGQVATMAVSAAPGEVHQVHMKLRRQSHGRPGRRQSLSWTVDCRSEPGIPTEHHGGEMTGWAVELAGDAAASPNWAGHAATACSAKIAGIRLRNGYVPAPVMGDC
jgi:hypothetical protein